jgi:hypothetical protein
MRVLLEYGMKKGRTCRLVVHRYLRGNFQITMNRYLLHPSLCPSGNELEKIFCCIANKSDKIFETQYEHQGYDDVSLYIALERIEDAIQSYGV